MQILDQQTMTTRKELKWAIMRREMLSIREGRPNKYLTNPDHNFAKLKVISV